MPDHTKAVNRIERNDARMTLERIAKDGRTRYAVRPENIAARAMKHFGVVLVWDDKFLTIETHPASRGGI